ncbi:MAG: HAMP domain-containing sensor histidine kinase [Gemmatimonadaceae bacterium]
MQSARRLRSNALLLAALLLGTLVLATMLAYEAHDAARSHRAAAERSLHDYAAVAAFELVAGVSESLQSSLAPAFAFITRSRASSPYDLLPAPALLAETADSVLACNTAKDSAGRFYFRVDFRNDSLATAGAIPAASVRRWLTDTIVKHAHTVYQEDWNYAVLIGGPRGEPASTYAYAVKFAEHGAIAAYGVRGCETRLGPAIAGVVAHRPLLPASATGGAPNDSIVSVTVRDAAGHTLFQSERTELTAYAADVPLVQAGSLTARVTIRPHGVAILALGAVPGSRVSLLVGLLTLTAAMIGVTVMQLRREHELSRLRSDFISSVSHELRTPLSQILLFAETLNLGRIRSDEERHAATDVIVQEGRRLMHLVENILHFSRAEREMTRLGVEPLDLSAVVCAIVEDWRPLAAAADVRIETQLATDVHAVADRSALRQMLLNLLDNAVKYGPASGTVIVGTSANGTGARVWVEDQGQGIPADQRELVWSSYYRLDRDARSAVAGSGIGLYVVRELARLHGGSAWVEAAAGGGARFVVEVPV